MERGPLVAVTCYPPDAEGRVALPQEYIDAVRRARGRPVLVPPGEPEPLAVLERCDALVLAGGGDIRPEMYGGASHPMVYGGSAARDDTENALVGGVLRDGIPTLAICRGMQVLNVVLGGSLHAHLPDVVGDDVVHRIAPGEPAPHSISIAEDSLVARTMGAVAITPMSSHHQAVDHLGRELRAVGWAEDGVVEAVEHATHPWLAAVQWHPELTADRDPTQQALFDGLVAAAVARGRA
jgi:putative glutamine amidotransferase